MVVRLRLQRFGRTHSPFYRMVAADSRAPRDGKFIEIVSCVYLYGASADMFAMVSCLDLMCCDGHNSLSSNEYLIMNQSIFSSS